MASGAEVTAESTSKGNYLTIWASERLIAALTETAWRRGLSRSAYARQLLEAGVQDTTP